MPPVIRLVLVLAAGAGIGIGGVILVQTVFGDIPAIVAGPATIAECEGQLAALRENPVCAEGKERGKKWMRDFTVSTPVKPHAMPDLSYEKKQ